jgi:Lrp/AsnC family transcriptional regulator
MQEKLGPIDRKILRLLQHNADLSAAEIAEKVELSQSPCWRRIHRMQEEGLIERKVALLNPKLLGLGMTVFVDIKLSAHGRKNLEEFEQAVVGYSEVLECYTMAGGSDGAMVTAICSSSGNGVRAISDREAPDWVKRLIKARRCTSCRE